MVRTPFNAIVKKLHRKITQLPPNDSTTDRVYSLYLLCQTCRFHYINLLNISKSIWKSNNGLLDELTLSEQVVFLNIAYSNFISDLNRHGRYIKDKFRILIPLLPEITLYRNVVAEHWDEYKKFQILNASGFTCSIGRIAIPSHIGAVNVSAKKQKALKELQDVFQKNGIIIPDFDLSWSQSNYATAIFDALRKVNPKLNPNDGRIKVCIQLIFKYQFPIPIHNVEDYSKELAQFVDEQTI